MQQGELQWTDKRTILSVSQLVQQVRVQLETTFRDLWIQGEISNFKEAPSGHLYFTLKDRESQLKAVCFRLQAAYLRFRPQDGMKVLARGSVSVYPPRGDFQLLVETMEPAGQGALQLEFEKLKAKLQAEGLFDLARKRPLPQLPSKIGLITSPAGAALQDILRVLERRNDRIDVLIFPVRVQGSGAGDQVARAVAYLGRRPDIDVIIVARGGGSLEDLWAFNEERPARAVFSCPVPVISAVGHETDVTILDFVADLRAPTPSAAAEMVAVAHEELCSRLQQMERRMAQSIRLLLHEKRRSWQRVVSNRAFVDAETRLHNIWQRLDDLQARLLQTLPARIEPLRRRLAAAEQGLPQHARLFLHKRRGLLELRSGQLAAFSPLSVLERGYAIVTTPDKRIVRSPEAVSPGGRIQVRLARGKFSAVREEDEEKHGI